MSALHTDVITVFNKSYSRESGAAWYPTVISGVHLDIDKAGSIAKYKVNTGDIATALIPYEKDGEKKKIAGKEWVPPVEWGKQTDVERRNTITFSTETQTPDFFWFGTWERKEPAQDDDYGGNFYQYMKSNEDYVFAITSVGANYKLIPHVEITGK